MSLFRRREPLRVGRAGEDGGAVTNDPEPTRPAWDASGIHGLHRVREWDVVTTVEAPTVVGDRAEFVAVSARELAVIDGPDDVEPLAAPVERELTPPYRAEAIRRHGNLWAVAARQIEVMELPGLDGDELELTVRGDERRLVVDGVPAFGSIPALERPESVTRAYRVGGDVWEVEFAQL